MKYIRKLICLVIGHSYVPAAHVTTERSQWGTLICARCGEKLFWNELL